MASITTIVVNGRSYRVDVRPDDLKAQILAAVRSGGDWVSFTTVGGRRCDVLITPGSHARVETEAEEDAATAGSAQLAAFGVGDFDEYGL
jgi:hypothetical protein